MDDITTLKNKAGVTLHTVGFFSLLISSTVGVSLPILSKKSAMVRNILSEEFMRNCKIFGTGSILSTAFVHLFGSGFSDIVSAKEAFGKFGASFAGVFCLFGVFFMMAADYANNSYIIFSKRKERTKYKKQTNSVANICETGDHEIKVEFSSALRTGIIADGSTPKDSIPSSLEAICAQPTKVEEGACCGGMLLEALAEGSSMQRKLGLYALEFGIAFHSVIVGITLGISKDEDSYFKLLLVLILHQLLEGFALGSMAAHITLTRRAIVILLFAFSLTTPVGALLGSILANTAGLSENSTATVVTRGVFSTISAGIMIYSSIVEAVLPEIQSECFHERKWTQQLHSLFWFFAGVILMSAAAFGEDLL